MRLGARLVPSLRSVSALGRVPHGARAVRDLGGAAQQAQRGRVAEAELGDGGLEAAGLRASTQTRRSTAAAAAAAAIWGTRFRRCSPLAGRK